MSETSNIYRIGDKQYIQRPLVLGQVNQLMGLLKGLVIPAGADPMMLISVLGVRLPKALAIVLIEGESGVKSQESGEKNSALRTPHSTLAQYLRGRDLDALAQELEFAIDSETTFKVIEDFFDCNPIASLLEKFAGMTKKIGGKITAPGSKASAASSPAETSQSAAASSGASPSPKPGRI